MKCRAQYVRDDEEELWKTLSLHDMSDEEDGDEVFKRKTPTERTPDVRELIEKLDQRHAEKLQKSDRRVLKVKRVNSDSPRKVF